MVTEKYRPFDDAETLSRLYHGSGMTQQQIADLYGVSQRTISRAMHKNGVTTRYRRGPVSLSMTNGYPRWNVRTPKGNVSVYVHQLLAIAMGHEPEKVFSDGDYNIHHKNGVKWDNRPENIELLTASEHRQLHHERGDHEHSHEKRYTDEELLEWLRSFRDHFGVVPTHSDLKAKGWPGPSHRIYDVRFGKFTNAVKAAGMEPRGRTGSERGDTL